MEGNRIGAECWYKIADGPCSEWRRGWLRAWSTDHERCAEDGEWPIPVGVIEDQETLYCLSVYVERICFADEKPV